MSSAKAALESDTRVLAYEAGRKHSIRVNAISAGPLGSRAAKAIGFIDDMIKCAPVLALQLPGMAWQDRSVTRHQQTGPTNPAASLVWTAAKLSSVLVAKCWLGKCSVCCMPTPTPALPGVHLHCRGCIVPDTAAGECHNHLLFCAGTPTRMPPFRRSCMQMRSVQLQLSCAPPWLLQSLEPCSTWTTA